MVVVRMGSNKPVSDEWDSLRVSNTLTSKALYSSSSQPKVDSHLPPSPSSPLPSSFQQKTPRSLAPTDTAYESSATKHTLLTWLQCAPAEQWTAHVHPSSGATYYHNAATGESTYEVPPSY